MSDQYQSSAASLFAVAARQASPYVMELQVSDISENCPDCEEATLVLHSRGRRCICTKCQTVFFYLDGKVVRG